MKNKKLFIGLLVISAFLGSCASLFSPSNLVKNIPPSFFEENRGEGERLVYITLERADATNESVYAGGETQLFILTDDAAIEGLTAPYSSVSSVARQASPSIQNSILIFDRGLAVFSLPKSQENIVFSTFCSIPVRSERVTTGLSIATQTKYSMGRFYSKIDPEAGDIAIRVILSPNSDIQPEVLTSTSGSNIQQMISRSNRYGSRQGTGTPGFIVFP